MLKCKTTTLADTVYPLIMADVPVRILGPTGVGKSAIMNTTIMSRLETDFAEIVGKENPVVMHDYRLSTKDIVDGTGMPIIDKDERATYWTRPAFIPADDGRMHVIFLDEFGHASVQLQQLAYGLVLDRALGGFKLPKLNRVILASNTREDQGGDNKTLKPLENRMAHVQVEVDEPGFLELTKQWGWDKRLIAFLNLRPNLVHKVDVNNPAFPTPRSLENFNKVLTATAHLESRQAEAVLSNAAQAILGEGFAVEFGSFLKRLGAGLPKLQDILSNPTGAKVPADVQHHYVIAGTITRNLNAKNAAAFAQYLARLSPDVASMAVHDAFQRDNSLKNVKALTELLLEGSGQ